MFCWGDVIEARVKELVSNLIQDSRQAYQKKFIAEVIGTFILVVFATGSIVVDAKINSFWQ